MPFVVSLSNHERPFDKPVLSDDALLIETLDTVGERSRRAQGERKKVYFGNDEK